MKQTAVQPEKERKPNMSDESSVMEKARELISKHNGDRDAAANELVEWMNKQPGEFRGKDGHGEEQGVTIEGVTPRMYSFATVLDYHRKLAIQTVGRAATKKAERT